MEDEVCNDTLTLRSVRIVTITPLIENGGADGVRRRPEPRVHELGSHATSGMRPKTWELGARRSETHSIPSRCSSRHDGYLATSNTPPEIVLDCGARTEARRFNSAATGTQTRQALQSAPSNGPSARSYSGNPTPKMSSLLSRFLLLFTSYPAWCEGSTSMLVRCVTCNI